jgi:multicomponent Na+:H+ antiporter subunit E
MSQPATEPRPGLVHYLFTFMVTTALWLLLVGNLHPQELIVGLVAAFLVTVLAAPHLGIFTGLRFSLFAPIALLRYLRRFLIALIHSNLDVARRVLSPSLPIRPAVVEIETELESALGRLMLANSITLTPGTLVVDVNGERLFVHWIDCPPGTDLAAATRAIASDFESDLKGFLK